MIPTTALIFLAATAMASPTADFKEAERLCAEDKFGEAEKLYRSSLETADFNLKRQSFDGLIRLYIRSGREDKAITLAEKEYKGWLRAVGNTTGLAELELTIGGCWHWLGYPDRADPHLDAALAATPSLLPGRRLEALRLRAEAAAFRQDPEQRQQQRWKDLEVVARDTIAIGDLRLQVTVAHYLGESLFRQNMPREALAVLDPLPKLHDKLRDSTGLRETQLQRDKPDGVPGDYRNADSLFKESLTGRRDTQLQRAKLYGVLGDYRNASPLFQEALDLHLKAQPNNRMVAGDILAEWAAAAFANKEGEVGKSKRLDAANEYKKVLTQSSDTPAGTPLAAYIRFQNLNRKVRQRDYSKYADRWNGDNLLTVRLSADDGGRELLDSKYKDALEKLLKAKTDIDTTPIPNLRALPQLLVNLATAELAVGTPDRAEERRKQCVALYSNHALPQLLVNVATAELVVTEDPVEKRLTECIALYTKYKLPDDPIRAECEYVRGVAAARRGEYNLAIERFGKGLTIAEKIKPAADPVRFNLLLNIALIHKEQGNLAAAEDGLRKADELLPQAEPDDLTPVQIAAVRADLLVTQGLIDKAQMDKALELIERIDAYCDKTKNTGYLWTTSRHIHGLDRLIKKDYAGAVKFWKELEQFQGSQTNVLLPRTLNYLGVVLILQGRDAEAKGKFKEAREFQAEAKRKFEKARDLQNNLDGGSPVTRAITLWRLAALEYNDGRKTRANALLDEVFVLADKARLKTFGAEAQRAEFFFQFAPAFELAAKWAALDGDGERLLQIVARSRSRTLLDKTLAAGVNPSDRLADGLGNVDRETGISLLELEKADRKKVCQLRGEIMLLPKNAPEPTGLLTKLKAAQMEHIDRWRKIAEANPLTYGLADERDEAEKSLKRTRMRIHEANGALLTYMLGHDESYAILCTNPATPPEVFHLTVEKSAAPGDSPLPLTDKVARRLVDHYLGQLRDPGSELNRRSVNIKPITLPDRKQPIDLVSLGDVILPKDLRVRIRKSGVKRLVIIPDGALHKLPFEALLVSGETDSPYALDNLPAICYAPSLAVLTVLMDRPRPTSELLLTVADPDFQGTTHTPLPYSREESHWIRKSFRDDLVDRPLLGKDATELNVRNAIAGKRVVHLATHGKADEEFDNRFAAIVLTQPPPGPTSPDNDGYLYLHEIHRLDLTKCELTVLSACETNVGPQLPLEAGVTLAGAFLSAGSRGVIASYWSVSDPATAKLMAKHFEAVFQRGAKSHADALKTARLAIKSTPEWEKPFYWAAFGYLGPPE